MTKRYSFWIYGSGRWAKILAQQLQILYGDNALLNFITNRDQSELKCELKHHKIKGFNIVEDLELISGNRLHLGIVCGRARDNYNRVMKLLGAGLNVYVEKPCSLNLQEVDEMVKYADLQRLSLYFSNAFLFNDQINSLISETLNKNKITKIKINWLDEKPLVFSPANLKYDVSLTIYEDVLPHVLNIVASILKTEDIEFIAIDVARFGQKVKIKCLVSNIETELILERNGSKKIRNLEIHTFTDIKIFDFSHRRSSSIKSVEEMCKDGDLGPLAMSLHDFVSSVEKQRRSNFNNEVLARKIIELFPKIEEIYLSGCLADLKDKSQRSVLKKEDLIYLTAEISERMKFSACDHKKVDVDHAFMETTNQRYRQLESQLKKLTKSSFLT